MGARQSRGSRVAPKTAREGAGDKVSGLRAEHKCSALDSDRRGSSRTYVASAGRFRSDNRLHYVVHSPGSFPIHPERSDLSLKSAIEFFTTGGAAGSIVACG
jgi:hypothetical protein